MSWNDFEHSIWKQLKSESLTDTSQFILAISGGLDSMVLLKALQKLKPLSEIIVTHFHHGESAVPEIKLFRDQAFELVKAYCQSNSLKFLSQRAQEKLSSENDFRKARNIFFNQVRTEFPQAIFATAHHKDDLLETWLLKMIRGSGVESLENFKFWDHRILRPLLIFTKAEVLAYAKTEGVSWIEDPSNEKSDYLRNWLRNQWLKDLSAKIPGSIENLTDSLSRLVAEVRTSDPVIEINYDLTAFGAPTKASFSRAEYLILSHSDQVKTLARALKGIGQRSFSQGQLEEIIKRLDKNQKDILFSVAGVNWFINAQQVMLQLEELKDL